MRLLDIKKRLVSEFFTSSGIGCQEGLLLEKFNSAFELIKLQPIIGEPIIHDQAKPAYKELSKGTKVFAFVCEGDDVLYACARNGKLLSCLNFTSPTQTSRYCTLREVKEAFVEAESRGATFKVLIETKDHEKLLQALIKEE